MTTRPSDPDDWYAPDAAPVPEGMETTAQDIINAHAWTKDQQRADPWVRETLGHLVRDHERALAEVARQANEKIKLESERDRLKAELAWYQSRYAGRDPVRAALSGEGATLQLPTNLSRGEALAYRSEDHGKGKKP